MAEFPLDLYPPADFTREDILRQIFGEVGNLCHGEFRATAPTADVLYCKEALSTTALGVIISA